MSVRYFASAQMPISWVNDFNETITHQPSCTVYEADCPSVNTGLLSEAGVPLWRVVEREPIGFKPR